MWMVAAWPFNLRSLNCQTFQLWACSSHTGFQNNRSQHCMNSLMWLLSLPPCQWLYLLANYITIAQLHPIQQLVEKQLTKAAIIVVLQTMNVLHSLTLSKNFSTGSTTISMYTFTLLLRASWQKMSIFNTLRILEGRESALWNGSFKIPLTFVKQSQRNVQLFQWDKAAVWAHSLLVLHK